MTRVLACLLLLAALVAAIWTVVDPEAFGGATGWFPAEVGRGAEVVDALFARINAVIAALLVLTFTLLVAAVWRGARRSAGEGSDAHGSGALEVFWTVVPALVLGWLTFDQIGARGEIADAVAGEPDLVVVVEGAQFDWRFRYPGDDGVHGTLDDVVEVGEMPLPVGRVVEARMVTRDVIHSFFVPALRLKRDLVPGTETPLRFAIDADDLAAAGDPDRLDLRCAELCGWGHATMVGTLRPMRPADFDAWHAGASAARFQGDGAPDPLDGGEDEDE